MHREDVTINGSSSFAHLGCSVKRAVMNTSEATSLCSFAHCHGVGSWRTRLEWRASTCPRLFMYTAKLPGKALYVIISVWVVPFPAFAPKLGILILKKKPPLPMCSGVLVLCSLILLSEKIQQGGKELHLPFLRPGICNSI